MPAPRSHHHVPAVAALVLALLATVLGGALALSPAGATVAERAAVGKDRDAGLPVVGTCRAYSYRAVAKASESSAAVPCTDPHTAQTVGVVRLKGKGKVDGRSLERAYVGCQRALSKAVGPALPTTAYRLAYFRPSKAEQRLGARWVRCDVTLRAGKALAPLPTPLVTAPVTDAIGICAVVVKGTAIATTCAARHDYRYTSSFRIKGSRYPGDTKVLRKTILTCAKKVSTPKKFWSFYPDALDWKAGQRTVSCLSRTQA